MVGQRIALAVVMAVALGGCSAGGTATGTPIRVFLPPNRLAPAVAQKGNGAQWVQFTPRTTASLYSAIVAGPDGSMWFLDENAGGLVRISLSGAIREFSLSGLLTGNAVSMAVGADSKFYISDESTSIVRVATNGSGQRFPIPSGDNTAIDGIALGPDGNIWFTEFNHLGTIAPNGTITEFAYPTQPGTNQYGGVTTGADGNIWFAQSSQNAIGRFSPTTKTFKMFPIAGSCGPAPVVLAKDGNVWFVCLTSTPLLGRVTPTGKIKTFPIGGTFNSNETEQFCARGPDGEPWCASGNDNTVFRVNTASHTVTTFDPPLASGVRPDAIAAGPDGNLWSDTAGATGEINVLVPNPITVTPLKLTFASTGQMKTVTVSEIGSTSWTAKSNRPAVATVAQGNQNSQFLVTSVGVGKCKITILDSAGNSAGVGVTVH